MKQVKPPIPSIEHHYYFADRNSFRSWLSDNHKQKPEAWLCWPDPHTEHPLLPYLDAVLEALCFGWIDGVEKRVDENWKAQRFTPRRSKGRWTELNKERCRQLIAQGLMTPAGLATLPNIDVNAFKVEPDVLNAIQANEQAYSNYLKLPEAYIRIRIDYIEERRRLPLEFERSLNSFIKKTAEGKLFGYFLPEIGIDAGGKEVIALDKILKV